MARLMTLIWLRFTLMRRGLRRAGAADTAVGVVIVLLAVAASIGLALSLGALARRSGSSGDEDLLRVVHLIDCYLFAFFAIGVPVIAGRGSQSLKVSQLAVYPISRPTLYGLNLLSGATSAGHWLWYPALVAVAVNGVLRAPHGATPGLLVLLLLACVLVVWSQTVLLLLEAAMRQRSVKEVVVVVGFVLFIGATLIPALIDSEVLGDRGRPAFVDGLLELLLPILARLPPSRVAAGLTAVHTGGAFSFEVLSAELLVWTAAGAVIGYLVLSRILLEGPSHIASRRRRRSRRKAAVRFSRPGFDPWVVLPGRLAAIVVKELHYQLRSTPGKLALLLAPIFVVMISLAVGKLMFAKQTLFGIEPAEYALYGVLLYAGALTANFLVNAFAWEGPGMKAYVLNPVAPRDVLLGKNLGVWLFNALILAECLLVWTVVRGRPQPIVAAIGGLLFATCVLILTIAGNFVSIRFPVRRSIASINSSPSQIGAVVTFASIIVAAILGGLALVVGLALGGRAVQLGLLTALVAVLVTAHWLVLEPAAELFEARQEEMVAALDGEAEAQD